MDGIRLHVHRERSGWDYFRLLGWLGWLLLSLTHVGGVGLEQN
jgi:hypothetical protein